MNQNQQKIVVDFVQGEASADIFPVNIGQKVILFDIDNPYVYQKERDNSGKLTKKKCRLEEEVETMEKPLDLSGYVKSDEIALIVANEVEKKLAEYNLRSRKVKEE